MNKKSTLVVTTIGNGSFLGSYAEQIGREGMRDDCHIIVIPDKKTKPELYQRVEEVKESGIKIDCPGLEEQEGYLQKIGDIHKIIPYNSDNRRNIGFLMALDQGCDFVISIDDDNYCRKEEPFFKEHQIVCTESCEGEAVTSSDGWFNVLDLMEVEPSHVYPRGFPYHSRFKLPKIDFKKEKGKVCVNTGLCLKEPDVDGFTWLVNSPQARLFKGKSVFLGRNTWTPINTQNTALHRDAVAAYYFVRMGYPIGGMMIDRYGDIFSGYFLQACMRHLGHKVRIGTPLVDHIRNAHNYLKDATCELGCIWLLEDLTNWLKGLKLQGSTYEEAYLSLADNLEQGVEKFSGFVWNNASRGYFREIADYMRIWVQAVKTVKG